MGNCACKQNFRFKRLIDAVYPSDPEGDAKADAISKLALYVEHNSGDVPRVCRRVRKRMDDDITAGKIKRVSVSAQVLHQLLLSTTTMEFYVPFVVDAADMLIAREEPEYRISGADLLSALGYQLTVHLDYDSTSRRLFADRCDASLRALAAMAAEGIGTQRIDSLHCRYSALVSLSNIAAALGPLLADRAEVLMQPVLRALLECAVEAEQRAQSAFQSSQMTRRSVRLDAAMTQLKWVMDAQRDSDKPIASVVLPLDPDAKDAKYRAACVRALSCIAPCATTASLPAVINAAIAFLSVHQGWATPTFAMVVCRVLASTLQNQHRSGFLVAQQVTLHLDAAVRASEEVVTMLRCLRHVVDDVPMSGSRPVTLFTSLSKYVTSASSVTGAEVSEAARETIATITIRSLTQRNVPAVARLLTALCKHVRTLLSFDAVPQAEQQQAPPTVKVTTATAAAPATGGGGSGGLRASSSGSLPVASLAATTASGRAAAVVELLSDLSTVAAVLVQGDRRDVNFVAAMLAVLRHSAADLRLCHYALLGLCRYVARPAVSPDGPFDVDGLPVATLQPYELDPVIAWVRQTYTSASASQSPAVLLGAADLVLCLYRAGAIDVCWTVDLLFDAQEAFYTQDTETEEGVVLHACLSAAIVRGLGGYLNARELTAYGEHVERLNLPKRLLSFAPPPPLPPASTTPGRRSLSLSSAGGDDSPTVFTPLSAYDDASPKASVSFNAVEEWQHAAAGSTLGCGLVLEVDVTSTLGGATASKKNRRAATPLSRPTVALYLSKQRLSNPRVAAELVGCSDDEAALRRLMGETLHTPRGVLTPVDSSVDLRLDSTVDLTTTGARRVDPHNMLPSSSGGNEEAFTAGWALRLQSFAKSLGGAVSVRPDVASGDRSPSPLRGLRDGSGDGGDSILRAKNTADDDGSSDDSDAECGDDDYKSWLGAAAPPRASSSPLTPSLGTPVAVSKVRLEDEPVVVG